MDKTLADDNKVWDTVQKDVSKIRAKLQSSRLDGVTSGPDKKG